MRVEEIMCTHLEICRPEDSLQAAAQSMWDHDIGILPVVAADGRLTSVITDRDIAMAAYTRGKPLGDIKVSEAMSKRLVTVLPSDDVHLAEERMRGPPDPGGRSRWICEGNHHHQRPGASSPEPQDGQRGHSGGGGGNSRRD